MTYGQCEVPEFRFTAWCAVRRAGCRPRMAPSSSEGAAMFLDDLL